MTFIFITIYNNYKANIMENFNFLKKVISMKSEPY